MKLVLHIGTPKTGTTALQEFFCINHKTLQSHGVFYAVMSNAINSNSLQDALVSGKNGVITNFFSESLAKAQRADAHTVLISAERLYAMITTAVQVRLRGQECDDYWRMRSGLISCLRCLISSEIETRIICYVRRPDNFLESLYNQQVKGDAPFRGSVLDFRNAIPEILDYQSHFVLWRKAFGDHTCHVRAYEAALPNIIDDFLNNVLNIEDLSNFVKPQIRVNERLNRDHLEYIRQHNRNVRPEERMLEHNIIREVNRKMGNIGDYQDYLSPQQRADLLSSLASGLERLCAVYNLPSFPYFDLGKAMATWQPYPGLTDEKRREIEAQYRVIESRVGYRLERIFRRTARVMRERVPILAWIPAFLRWSGMRQTLLAAAKRLQRIF